MDDIHLNFGIQVVETSSYLKNESNNPCSLSTIHDRSLPLEVIRTSNSCVHWPLYYPLNVPPITLLTKLFEEVILALPKIELKAMDFVFSPSKMITTDSFTSFLTLPISCVITNSVLGLYLIFEISGMEGIRI